MKYYILDVSYNSKKDFGTRYSVREEIEVNYPPDMAFTTILSEVDYKFKRVHHPDGVTRAIDDYLIPKALGSFISKLN